MASIQPSMTPGKPFSIRVLKSGSVSVHQVATTPASLKRSSIPSGKRLDEGVEELGADGIEVAALWQVGQPRRMGGPPLGQGLAQVWRGLAPGVLLNQRADSRAVG